MLDPSNYYFPIFSQIMFSKLIYLFIFTVHLLISFSVNAQSFSDEKRELKKLDGLSYLNKALDFSIGALKDGRFEDARWFKKRMDAESGSFRDENVKTTFQVEFAERVAATPNAINAESLDMIIEGLEYVKKNDKNGYLIPKVNAICKQINSATKDPLLLSKLYKFYVSYTNNSESLNELKNNNLSATENRELNNKNLDLSEKQKELAKQQAELSSKLDSKLTELNNLSDVAARQQLLLQYKEKLVDSLRFESIIDSMQVQQSQDMVNKQRAELQLKTAEINLNKTERRMFITGLLFAVVALLCVGYFFFQSKKYNRQLSEKNVVISHEKERSEKLLLNILPAEIAKELKANNFVEPKYYENATVLFTDFVNFSQISKEISTAQLVKDLNSCFVEFDRLAELYGIEKIKTIGDAYMCISGVPIVSADAAKNMMLFALDLQKYLNRWNRQRKLDNLPIFAARVGVHTGPLVAGVVGNSKFAFDVWGDTVNVAARMESKSKAGKVNVSQSTYELLINDFRFEDRGAVSVKNMPEMNMYFVKGSI